ncbi:MAG: hypothetical protein RBR69_08615 [Candidatus Cloacimonadaceae bacterium]|jgi:hypothetical protein|nr:hypothetical protein [Candidatus Cloacimonadota bacterium]MDY0128176.1 hypothetical protein [Candidatus Cloacimonadaceae bacterium]MCB5255480.1 hypothetical protein [Candidatus Cloacimonadota bacterium]MCK9179039.1 hypothetical protein [Candidatus Cloacimonadota bacterium]MCK9243258.1 hypothetical protein [Candidatus Cloacimonadota bacterium]
MADNFSFSKEIGWFSYPYIEFILHKHFLLLLKGMILKGRYQSISFYLILGNVSLGFWPTGSLSGMILACLELDSGINIYKMASMNQYGKKRRG